MHIARRERERLKTQGFTANSAHFEWLCNANKNRVGIVCEGDSWFAYPRKYLFAGRNSNIVDHLIDLAKNKANILTLSSSGDEAVTMISGRQKHNLARILKKHRNHIDFLLFSGGGNDVVGKWDLERLIVESTQQTSADKYINHEALARKLQRIRLAYEELIELRNVYSPNTHIVTHTYDMAAPSGKKGKFLWGLVKTGPWIRYYLEEKGIPKKHHQKIVEHLLTKLREVLLTLGMEKEKFYVVDTQGTLTVGDDADWRDEMHPTPAGFGKITEKIYTEMKGLDGRLK